jgi:aminomethyltransferase
MRAERDLLVASSACPDDVEPTNNFNPTDIMVRVFPA